MCMYTYNLYRNKCCVKYCQSRRKIDREKDRERGKETPKAIGHWPGQFGIRIS